jgi:hypothetical protein
MITLLLLVSILWIFTGGNHTAATQRPKFLDRPASAQPTLNLVIGSDAKKRISALKNIRNQRLNKRGGACNVWRL